MVLAVFFRWVGDNICSIGRQIGIPTLLFLFTFIGLVFIGPFEGNTMNAQHSSFGTSGMNNGTRLHIFSESKFGIYKYYEIVFPKSMSSLKPNQFSPTEHFSCPDKEPIENSLESCPPMISGFTPNVFTMMSQMQCTVEEGQNLHTTDDFKDSKCSLSKSFDTCQELQPVLRNELPSSYHKTSEEADTLAISKGKVKGSLVRRSYNKLSTWCSNFKTNVFSGNLGEKMEWSHLQVLLTYVFLLEFFLSLVMLLLMLVDVMFGFMGRRMGDGIRASIIVFTLGFVAKFINGPTLTLYQCDFTTLIYVVGHFLVFLSLMVEQTQRQQLRHLLMGMACVCLTLAVLGYSFSCISSEYVWAGVATLFFFVVFATLSG